MSDESKILNLLIDLRVVGKDDVEAANELLAEAGQETTNPEQNVTKSAAQPNLDLARPPVDRNMADEGKRPEARSDRDVPRPPANAHFGAADSRARAFDKPIADPQQMIRQTEEEKARLTRPIGNEGQINDVKNQGDLNPATAQGAVSQSEKGTADAVAGGGTMANDQRAFVIALADDLARRLGALKPDPNLSSAHAAAAAMETYFKNQPNPYGALLQQIYGAVQAAQSGHDATAVFWMNKFAELEAKISATNNLHASG